MRRRRIDRLPPPGNREKLHWFRLMVCLAVLTVLIGQGPPWERAETEEDNSDKFRLAGVEFESHSLVSFDESAALLQRLAVMADQLPPRDFPPPSQAQLKDWISELAPIFEREGFIGSAELPDIIQFVDFPPWVLGQTSCEEDRVSLNRRLASEFSQYTNTPEWLWTAAHETAHLAAKLCYEYFARSAGPSADPGVAESSTTAYALEVTASLAAEGNEPAAYAFIYGLRDAAMFSLVAAAVRENRVDELAATVREATDNPAWEYTALGLSEVMLRDKQINHQSYEISNAYGGRVIQYLLGARQDPNQESYGLLQYEEGGQWLLLSRSKFDATLYLLEHWEEYAAYWRSLQPR